MNYKEEILKLVSKKELDEWLKRNPKPSYWQGDKYSWAYTEMPVGRFFTWYRKKVLGWDIN
jgi:hypothetical protein